MSDHLTKWMPAVVFGVGAMFTVGISGQKVMPLESSLGTSIGAALPGYSFTDLPLSEQEKRVAGFDDFILRDYSAESTPTLGYSLYVGYYASQTQGKSIHSPKNCLPGGGWEALASSVVPVTAGGATFNVNRYIVQNGDNQALVFYWYQGRGHVEANEYRVKWNLLADAALRRRTEEALVRIVVPIPPVDGGTGDVEALAGRVAAEIIPELNGVLPG